MSTSLLYTYQSAIALAQKIEFLYHTFISFEDDEHIQVGSERLEFKESHNQILYQKCLLFSVNENSVNIRTNINPYVCYSPTIKRYKLSAEFGHANDYEAVDIFSSEDYFMNLCLFPEQDVYNLTIISYFKLKGMGSFYMDLDCVDELYEHFSGVHNV